VGSGSVVRKAIIDKNARIGTDVRIINRRRLKNYDGENYYVRDGIVIIPKNARIPDGTVI
jgi:glucose-1-phosphate adenylyltransferase